MVGATVCRRFVSSSLSFAQGARQLSVGRSNTSRRCRPRSVLGLVHCGSLPLALAALRRFLGRGLELARSFTSRIAGSFSARSARPSGSCLPDGPTTAAGKSTFRSRFAMPSRWSLWLIRAGIPQHRFFVVMKSRDSDSLPFTRSVLALRASGKVRLSSAFKRLPQTRRPATRLCEEPQGRCPLLSRCASS